MAIAHYPDISPNVLAAAVLAFVCAFLRVTAGHDRGVTEYPDFQGTELIGLGRELSRLHTSDGFGFCNALAFEIDTYPIIGHKLVDGRGILLDACLCPITFHLRQDLFEGRGISLRLPENGKHRERNQTNDV